MPYRYREVICPYCNHIFMWMEAPQDGPSVFHEYIKQTSGEVCFSAECPRCNQMMIVTNEAREGIQLNDKRFIENITRGL